MPFFSVFQWREEREGLTFWLRLNTRSIGNCRLNEFWVRKRVAETIKKDGYPILENRHVLLIGWWLGSWPYFQGVIVAVNAKMAHDLWNTIFNGISSGNILSLFEIFLNQNNNIRLADYYYKSISYFWMIRVVTPHFEAEYSFWIDYFQMYKNKSHRL